MSIASTDELNANLSKKFNCQTKNSKANNCRFLFTESSHTLLSNYSYNKWAVQKTSMHNKKIELTIETSI
jgi:hypothetical protein